MKSVGDGYHTTARLLHWTVAALVLGMIPAGLIMTAEGIPRSVQDALFIGHKNAGVLVLLLMIARLGFRLTHRPPPLPDFVPPMQRRVAAATHGLLYVVLFVMTLSGLVRVQAGGFPIELLDALGLPPLLPRSDALASAAKRVHFAAHYAIIGLVVLHVAGALFHAIGRRDGIVRRMWPPIAP